MNVVVKMIKELAIPLCVAGMYTILSLFNINITTSKIFNILNLFIVTLLFWSWFTDQYYKVKNNIKIENNFDLAQRKLVLLIDELENKTKMITNYITGGDSYCYLQIIKSPFSLEAKRAFLIFHKGDFPLYDVELRIHYNDKSKNIEPLDFFHKFDELNTIQKIGDLMPNSAKFVDIKDYKPASYSDSITEYNITVFWMSRNGPFEQRLKFIKHSETLSYATRVTRNGEVIYEDSSKDLGEVIINWDM